LPHALGDGGSQKILGEPASPRDQGADGAGIMPVVLALGIGFGQRFAGGGLADNAHGQRIVEDVGMIDQLMRSAPEGDGPGGDAWLILLHERPQVAESRAERRGDHSLLEPGWH
jgi:hypothetical protein